MGYTRLEYIQNDERNRNTRVTKGFNSELIKKILGIKTKVQQLQLLFKSRRLKQLLGYHIG